MIGGIINYARINIENRLDAEYFLPEFSDFGKNIKRTRLNKLRELCEFIHSGPSGSMIPSSAYTNGAIKVIRPSNLNGWTCMNGELAGISKNSIAERKIKLYRMGDILISRIGDLKFGIIEASLDTNFAISPNLFAIRTDKKLLDPYFLLVFLNTEKGFGQIIRGTKRGTIASINRRHIEDIRIPDIKIEKQREIGRQARDALANVRKAKLLIKRAEKILMQNIYGAFQKDSENNNFINLSSLKKALRADAEYFLSYRQVDKMDNAKLKYLKLGDITKLSRGIETGRDSYRSAGKLFLRTSNIGNFGHSGKSQKYITEELFSQLRKKYQPQVGELLLVKDGKPGAVYIVSKPIDGIISDGIVRLKCNGRMSAQYIYLCINSIFCRRQIKQDSDGTLVPHLKFKRIKELLIPEVPSNVQDEIADLVKKALRNYELSENGLRSARLEMERLEDAYRFYRTITE